MINLDEIARQALLARAFLPDYPEAAKQQLTHIKMPGRCPPKDMTTLPFFSIDNEDSRDLDQLTYADPHTKSGYKIFIAVSDVDAVVKKGSPIDEYAAHNTTSIYTPSKIFPMLPEKLSTNLTSLNPHEARIALIMEIKISSKGEIGDFDIYLACVKNAVQLNYPQVGHWLETGKFEIKDKKIIQQLKLQDEAAQKIKNYRHDHGALSLETIEARAVLRNGEVIDVLAAEKNRATELIENFMIAANVASTRFLEKRSCPTLRRIVRVPKRWDRIVQLAALHGEKLPEEPDGKALEHFLIKERKKDPDIFPDLSLSVIKLIGRGEYVVHHPGQKPIGHFGLSLRDYTHSTAPNRRFPDLITGRLLKAAISKTSCPYKTEELEQLAVHCTEKEDDAERVERQTKKSAAALILSHQINQVFNAFVTGSGPKGTWVRISHPPIEGKLIAGFHGLDVGDRLKVKLVHVDVAKGFIDFQKI